VVDVDVENLVREKNKDKVENKVKMGKDDCEIEKGKNGTDVRAKSYTPQSQSYSGPYTTNNASSIKHAITNVPMFVVVFYIFCFMTSTFPFSSNVVRY
jgi:hypothetical protein